MQGRFSLYFPRREWFFISQEMPQAARLLIVTHKTQATNLMYASLQSRYYVHSLLPVLVYFSNRCVVYVMWVQKDQTSEVDVQLPWFSGDIVPLCIQCSMQENTFRHKLSPGSG